MTLQSKHETKNLWKVGYAQESIMRSAHALQFILNGTIGNNHPLFASVLTGAYVLYARPFIDANGIGILSEKMVPKDLLPVHTHVLKVRHQLMAHRDSEPTLFSSDVPPPHIRITRIAGGGFQFSAHQVWPNKTQLSEMLGLCHGVAASLGSESGRIIAAHYNELPPEGDCVVNITDPEGPFFFPV